MHGTNLRSSPLKKLIPFMKTWCNKNLGIVVEEIAGTNTEEDTTIGTESLINMKMEHGDGEGGEENMVVLTIVKYLE